jgi:hypothetical protein
MATRNSSRSKIRNGHHKACPTKKIKKIANNTPKMVPANLLSPSLDRDQTQQKKNQAKPGAKLIWRLRRLALRR